MSRKSAATPMPIHEPMPCVFCQSSTPSIFLVTKPKPRNIPICDACLTDPDRRARERERRARDKEVARQGATSSGKVFDPWEKRVCVVCARAEPADHIGRCADCAKLSVDEANRTIEARRRAEEAKLDAQDESERRARREDEERAKNAAALDLLKTLLDGAPAPKALGDGGDSTTDVTALVPVSGGTTALACVSHVPGVAEERRRRRAACEASEAALKEGRAHVCRRRAELDKEIAPLRRQDHTLLNEINAITRRPQLGSVTADGIAIETFAPVTPEGRAEVSRLRDQWEPVRQRLAALGHEREQLDAEENAALDACRKATDLYLRWLDVERDQRLDALLTGPEGRHFTKACKRDGHPVSYLLGDFCGAECERLYQPFIGQWFARCATCGQDFTADENGGTGDIPVTVDGLMYHSYRCVSASSEDMDDFPGPDAACWSAVMLMPHPPLTGHERAAAVRKRLLREAYPRRTSNTEMRALAAQAQTEGPENTVVIAHALTVPSVKTTQAVLAALRAADRPLTLDELVSATNRSQTGVYNALQALLANSPADGQVARQGAGTKSAPHVYSFILSFTLKESEAVALTGSIA